MREGLSQRMGLLRAINILSCGLCNSLNFREGSWFLVLERDGHFSEWQGGSRYPALSGLTKEYILTHIVRDWWVPSTKRFPEVK